MLDWITEHYLWIKSFHIFFMVAWMAGIFYLPRLLAYHVRVGAESEAAQVKCIDGGTNRAICRSELNRIGIVRFQRLVYDAGAKGSGRLQT